MNNYNIIMSNPISQYNLDCKCRPWVWQSDTSGRGEDKFPVHNARGAQDHALYRKSRKQKKSRKLR